MKRPACILALAAACASALYAAATAPTAPPAHRGISQTETLGYIADYTQGSYVLASAPTSPPVHRGLSQTELLGYIADYTQQGGGSGGGGGLGEIELANPHQVDGGGAVIDATSTSPTYGHATFSGSADKTANFALYRFRVPFDLSTATDLSAAFTFRLAAADTGKHAFEISMASVAGSASADAPVFTNAVALNFAGDAGGAAGDTETIAYTTLTGWKSSLTAGHILTIKLARDGDDATNDTSAQAVSDVSLTLKFGKSQ